MKPNFIGIGVQKCATSWLYRILEDHPQAYVSQPKEINFFSKYYECGYQWYESKFKNGENAKAMGEFSPSYFCNYSIPEKIYAYDPNIKLIITLRDPIRRAFSQHIHNIRIGHVKGPDFSFETGLKNNPTYIDQSRYGIHLDRWFNVFPRNQFLILFQENIIANEAESARSLYNFLNINQDHTSGFLYQKSNVGYIARSKAIDKIMMRTANILRKVGFENAVKYLRNIPPISTINIANRASGFDIVPSLQANTKKRLENDLANDLNLLQNLLKMDNFPWETWDSLKPR